MGMEIDRTGPLIYVTCLIHLPRMGRIRNRGCCKQQGMIIGALIIVLMDYVFGVLVVQALQIYHYTTANRIDDAFIWLVTEQWEVTKLFIAISVIGLVSRHRGILETGFWGAAIFDSPR